MEKPAHTGVIDALKLQLDQLNEKVARLKREMDDKDKEINELNGEDRKRRTEMDQIKAEANDMKWKLEENTKNWELERDQLKTEYDRWKQQTENLEGELRQLTKNIDDERYNTERETNNKDKEIERLTKQISDMAYSYKEQIKNINNAAEKAAGKLMHDLEQMENRLEAQTLYWEENCADINSQINALKEGNILKDNDLEKLRNEVWNMAEKGTTDKGVINALRLQLDQVNKEMLQLRKELEYKDDEVNDLNEKHREKEQDIENIKADANNTKWDYEEKIKIWENKFDLMETECKKWMQQAKTEQEKKMEKDKEIEDLKLEINKMIYNHKYKIENAKAAAELRTGRLNEDLEQMNKKLEAEKQYWKQTIADLNSQVDALKEENATKDKDYEDLRNEMFSLAKKERSDVDVINALEFQLNQLDQELSRVKQDLEE